MLRLRYSNKRMGFIPRSVLKVPNFNDDSGSPKSIFTLLCRLKNSQPRITSHNKFYVIVISALKSNKSGAQPFNFYGRVFYS